MAAHAGESVGLHERRGGQPNDRRDTRKVRLVASDRLDEIATYATPESGARTIRTVRGQSLLGIRAGVMSVIERRGITILTVTRPNKRFIIGSRPVVKLAKGSVKANAPAVLTGVGEGHAPPP